MALRALTRNRGRWNEYLSILREAAGQRTTKEIPNPFHPNVAQRVRLNIRKYLNKVDHDHEQTKYHKRIFPLLNLLRAVSFEIRIPEFSDDAVVKECWHFLANAPYQTHVGPSYGETFIIYLEKLLNSPNLKARFSNFDDFNELINETIYEIDAAVHDLHESTNGSRYLVTIMLALAYELIHQGVAGTATTAQVNSIPGMTEEQYRTTNDCINAAFYFIDNIDNQLSRMPNTGRSLRIVGMVLDRLKRLHDELPQQHAVAATTANGGGTQAAIYAPFVIGPQPTAVDIPARPHLGVPREARRLTVPPMKLGRELFNVQQWMLWHLAVIGYPVEIDVLIRCPRLVTAIEEALVSPVGGSQSRSALLDDPRDRAAVLKAITRWVLQLMVNRCLVYEITANTPPLPPEAGTVKGGASEGDRVNVTPETPNSTPNGESEWRYGIHRHLKRYCFQQMGVGVADYAAVDNFTLTLYADQPNDVPKLTPETHHFLRTTIAALSGYPEDLRGGAEYDALNRETADEEESRQNRTTRMRMLRAAYGILRSTYSVANVAQLGLEHERINGDGENVAERSGFFEELRRQIRWILNQARILTTERPDSPAFAPFYAEEIVWLYNECGVLSLAQGRLTDAIALFLMADRAAQKLEPEPSGPLRTLIALNTAIVHLERGYLESSRQVLDAIAADKRNEDAVRAIAKGYRALVHHINGHAVIAEKLYEEAIDTLVPLRKTRAASIFSRHLGDLLRRRDEAGRILAKQRVEDAIRLSIEDNHEDTRYLSLLARARMAMSEQIDAEISKEVHTLLDTVERYATATGMPRLTAETAEIRARLHYRNGDLKTAGSVCTFCLQLASLHEMRLRKVGALSMLAQINDARGDRHASHVIAEEAAALARRTEHHFESAEIDKILQKT